MLVFPAIDLHMPRPDKKSGAKKQMKSMEDLLRSIAGNTHLRSNHTFVNFLTPDDQFGRFTESDHSEVVGIVVAIACTVSPWLRIC